jgi:uncharacterized protein DUF6938
MKFESNTRPVVTGVTMGYGHLRAAYPIAERLGVDVLAVDAPPIADAAEARLWAWVRRMHEVLSKPMPFLGPFDRPARGLMDAITMIPPLHESRDHRAPTWSVRLLDRMIGAGLGRGMVEHLRQRGAPLITTFYAPAIIADRAGLEHIVCVVTDADCNRVWAPLDAARTRIHYAAPTPRVVRRLRSFGVPERNITLTGFPLPPMLTMPSDTTSPELRLAERIARLDPRGIFRDLHGQELARLVQGNATAQGQSGAPATGQKGARSAGPIHLMFAVGGAGAQAELVDQFLPSLRPLILDGRLRLQLVAGTRPEVLRAFVEAVERNGLERVLDRDVTMIHGADFKSYYEMMNRALLRTDVLWTKPSELSFYPALGLACMLSRPLGAHERYNRRWLREQGVGLKHRRLDHASGWFEEWLEDGTLAAAAWSGFVRLPKHGAERIVQLTHDLASGGMAAPPAPTPLPFARAT